MQMANKKRTPEKKASTKNGILRLIFVAIAILLEAALIFGMFLIGLDRYAEVIAVVSRFLALLLVLAIYSQNTTVSIKTPWIILILVFPAVGITLYVLIGLSGSTARMRRRFEEVDAVLLPCLVQDPGTAGRLQEWMPACGGVSRYIYRESGYPVFENAGTVYFPDASEALEAQKQAMRGAESFIFMEYFAIEDAGSWREIEDILAEKVKEGVEVRVFYDDLGSIGFINTDFARKLEEKGIRCRVFNPMIPVFNLFLNNRDHRKMTIVDGRTGFTGGYNIADEYFNRTSLYGRWKDTGVRLTGPVVRAMTVTFLEMWNAVRADDRDDAHFVSYLPEEPAQGREPTWDMEPARGREPTWDTDPSRDMEPARDTDPSQDTEDREDESEDRFEDGFVQFYADNPMDKKLVGEDVYLSLVCQAREYLYIMTPYLIITDEMSRMLGLAARRGVDVRIITPGIPDKKIVYELTRSYYARLAWEGVRIYEYTPGFCHAKMCVSDDIIATCGTINFDYRSLYHHFEDGCVLFGCEAVSAIRRDFEETFPVCREVTEKYRSGRSAVLRLGQLVLRLFAPLM